MKRILINKDTRPPKRCTECGRAFWRKCAAGQWARTRYCSIACSENQHKKTAEARIEDGSIPEPNSGCWLWLGTLCKNGYAQTTIGRSKSMRVNRLSFETHKGRIPSGKIICHTCDVRSCVNPSHLYAGTHANNSSDAVTRGRTLKGSKNHQAKLRFADIPTIRADPRQHDDIAADYGVARTTITAIKRRVIWKHVR